MHNTNFMNIGKARLVCILKMLPDANKYDAIRKPKSLMEWRVRNKVSTKSIVKVYIYSCEIEQLLTIIRIIMGSYIYAGHNIT